jgi:Protein of unknown function (DUF2939)
MKSAAKEKDPVKLSGYVNFSAVRENLKANFNAKLSSELIKEKDNSPFSVIGGAFVSVIVDHMVDQLVTPEGLFTMMNGENPHPTEQSEPPASSGASDDVETSMSYENFDRFVVSVKKKNENKNPLFSLYP